MKFTIGKRLFGQAVRAAHAFSDSTETRRKINQGYDVSPFRYPVTLAATPLGLQISAYDGVAILTQHIPAGIAAAGSVSLDTQALRAALVRPKARDIVTFEAHQDPDDPTKAVSRLRDGDTAAELEDVHTGAHHHPAVQLGEQLEARLELPAAELAAIIAETAFAASSDPTRPYLNGLFIESQNGRLRTVATDAWRLAIRDTNIPLDEFALPDDGFNGRGAILPLKAMRALQRLLKGGGSAVIEIWATGARIRCRAGDVVTQFVDGSFPDYRRVTPAGPMESTLLDLSTLADAVKAASSGARSARHWPKVTLYGHVTLTARSDSGHHDGAETLLPIECQLAGDPFAFNGWHLEDAGRAFGRVGTAMRYWKPEHPAVFVSPDRPELVIVQMPTRA